MKRFVAFMIFAVSLGAAAQFPNLPYNPDENGDGLIGVVDLQGLLSNYGNEFASAVVSEDGESAIVYMGEMHYAPCALACQNLPGHWQTPEIEDLALIWDEICNANTTTFTWMKASDGDTFRYFYSNDVSTQNSGSHIVATSNSPVVNKSCYCAAKQIPRVEYDFCEGFDIQECISLKVSEGWLPLGATESEADNCQCGIRYHQSFWRWAE